jgi:hypothetical protein
MKISFAMDAFRDFHSIIFKLTVRVVINSITAKSLAHATDPIVGL